MDEIDEAGVCLIREYQREGCAAFIIRTTDDGHVRVIGLSLPKGAVASMLREAATQYELQAPVEGKAN